MKQLGRGGFARVQRPAEARGSFVLRAPGDEARAEEGGRFGLFLFKEAGDS